MWTRDASLFTENKHEKRENENVMKRLEVQRRRETRKAQTKKLLAAVFSLALIVGLLPGTAFAADPIATDVVIHKRQVSSGTTALPHDGTELTSAPGIPMPGIIFKYWTVSDSVTDAQKGVLAGLSTLAEVEAYAAANPSVLSNPQTTGATNAQGTVTVANMAEGKYIFAEMSNPSISVAEGVGVPFLLELPAMKPDRTAYFGTGANALHAYPKNVLATPGLDVETRTTLEGGPYPEVRLGGTQFELQDKDGNHIEDFMLPNGFATIEDLPEGDYRLVNTVVPDGYLVDNRPIYFSVENGQIIWDEDGKGNPNSGFEPGTDGNNDLIWLDIAKIPYPNKALSGTDAKEASHSIGDVISWTVAIPVPRDIAEYNTYQIVDTLDSQLLWVGNGNVAVIAGGSIVPSSAYTSSTSGQALIINFIPSALVVYEGETLTVTYDTMLNGTAIVGGELAKNNVDLNFDNGHGAMGTTKPPDTPGVWTGGVKFVKIERWRPDVKLPGAEFKIATNAAGTDFITWNADLIYANSAGSFASPTVGQDIVMVSDAQGRFEIKGLAAGTYYLVEIKAPIVDGTVYNLMRDPAPFEISKTSWSASADGAVQIANNKGWAPPSTGGIGTILFTIIGAALMGLAVLVFLRKKKEVPSAS